ncbi:lipopolysaccharide biosynthesis protein [Clostridium perfringens]
MIYIYILNMILMFIARRIFIRELGADITGLKSLFTSLIGFLNVAELGIASAVGYSLYKPLSEKNYEKVNEIMILFKGYYNKIAKIIFIVGITLSISLPFLIKGQVNILETYIYYYMYLINCSISYLFTYKQTLIIADQKQYKIASTLNFVKIIKVLVQSIQLFIIQSFFVWLIIELLFNILGMISANYKVDKEYSNKITYLSQKSLKKLSKENILIKKNIKNIFFHRIGGVVVFQTDAILISIFSNLKEIAIYDNYMMIINTLVGFINNAIGSIAPTIGNLIVEESKEKCYKIFNKLYVLDHLVSVFITFVFYQLINRFIVFWVGSEYLFSNYITFILIINLYIQLSRGSIDRFKNGFGIYWDVASPIIESLLNLIFSLILTYKFGIIGVFGGTLISNILIIEIWKPYILFREGFGKKFRFYILKTISIFIKNIIIYIISNSIYNNICFNIENSFLNLVINMLSASLICLLISIIVYSFDKDFREFLIEIFKKYLIKLNFKSS